MIYVLYLTLNFWEELARLITHNHQINNEPFYGYDKKISVMKKGILLLSFVSTVQTIRFSFIVLH